MERIKINLPEHFNFSTNIKIRITDLNYGGHGNSCVLYWLSYCSVLGKPRAA